MQGFKLKSKLSPTKYPCLQTMDEILQWLTFAKSVDPYELDPVFLGRLGAMAKEEGRKHIIISGHRNTKKQETLYLNAGGVKNADGTYSDPHGKVNGKVAKPNTSWHEFRLAVDSGDKYYKEINKTEATKNQTKWIKFGLFKPLTIGNGIKASSTEDWHLQVLESKGIPKEKRKQLEPTLIVIEEKKPKTSLEILYDNKIISNIMSWENWLKSPFIQGEIAKALIVNFYKNKTDKTDFIEAINYLMSEKIISSKEYWLDNCAQTKFVKSEWVKLIIDRMAENL